MLRPVATPTEAEALLAATLAEIVTEFPRFRIVYKDTDRLSRAIDRALRIVTLGGQRRYLSHYHTVLGHTLYVPASWAEASPTSRVITLRHERVHLRQARRYGAAGLTLLYLLPILPLGLALGRARLEWEAYRETLAATFELEGEAALRSPELARRVVEQFTSAAYGWMWPFRRQVERWYDEAVTAIVADGAGRSTAYSGTE